ncbi:hypothetical protein V8E55_009252 [Tylopilus felleus]
MAFGEDLILPNDYDVFNLGVSTQPSFTSSMAFSEDFIPCHIITATKVPPNDCDIFNLRVPTPTMQGYQPCIPRCSIPENIPRQANQVYHDPSVLTSTQGAGIKTAHNLGLWIQSDQQPVAEVLSASCPPTAMGEGRGSYVMSIPCTARAYGSAQNLAHSESHATSDSHSTSWLTSADRQPLSPFVVDEISTLRPLLDQSSTFPFHACSSHATSHPTSNGFLKTEPRSHLRVLRLDSASPSRRRRAARAIEHDGVWVDEEELVKGLMEPDGKLTVHPCRWEQGRAPCHPWIRGDESSINAHIQKWHRGKPGGDKSRVDCRWSACGKTMRKDSIARHIVTKHLGEMWECQGCGKEIIRSDVYRQHVARSDFDACRTSGALVTYSADAREIDACAALEGAQRQMCAGTK